MCAVALVEIAAVDAAKLHVYSAWAESDSFRQGVFGYAIRAEPSILCHEDSGLRLRRVKFSKRAESLRLDRDLTAMMKEYRK
jgi:hypothetical protein